MIRRLDESNASDRLSAYLRSLPPTHDLASLSLLVRAVKAPTTYYVQLLESRHTTLSR